MKQIKHFIGLELKAGLKRRMALIMLIFTLFAILLPVGTAVPEDSENNLTISKDGFFDGIITYLKNLYPGAERELQTSETISKAAIEDVQQSADSGRVVLKIATPSVVKSASLIGIQILGFLPISQTRPS